MDPRHYPGRMASRITYEILRKVARLSYLQSFRHFEVNLFLLKTGKGHEMVL